MLKKRMLGAALGMAILVQMSLVLVSMFSSFARDKSTDYMWVGAVQSTSAAFRVRAPKGSTRRFTVATNSTLKSGVVLSSEVDLDFVSDFQLIPIAVSTLSPKTKYYFGQLDPNNGEVLSSGSFMTPAKEGTVFNFRIAVGGCQLTGSRSNVFNLIKSKDPFMFLHGGDFHYMDLDEEAVDDRVVAFDRVFASETASQLYSNVAFSYMWDDHDMCANNQNSECEKVKEARQAYQKVVPHYDLPAAALPSAPAADVHGFRDVSPYQAFTIGTVRFIITDLRSDAKKSTDDFAGSIYSEEQKQWLYTELANSTAYDFVVWLSSKPWIGPEVVGGDNWQGFAKDRQELSNHIADHIGGGKQNLLVVSSDAHMLAYDDGTNTAYNTNKTYSAGFPILQSGPLHNLGSTKGGPFSEGCFTYKAEMNNQYSTIDFEFDAPTPPCIKIRSYSMITGSSEEMIFEKTLCGEIFAPKDAKSTPGSSCNGAYLRPATLGLAVTTCVLFLFGAGVSLAVFQDRKFVGKVLAIAFFASCLAIVLGLMPFAAWLSHNHFQINMLSSAATSFVVVLLSLGFLAYCRWKGKEEASTAIMNKSMAASQVGCPSPECNEI